MWTLLAIAISLLAVGFVINVVAGALRMESLFFLGAAFVGAGVVCALVGVVKAARGSDR
ncbi:MAG TPA: hypothetical protein VML94_03285 [Thermoplasmata archaeon]|nr:hypothetical protein [Thermoplasmata archaeon]